MAENDDRLAGSAAGRERANSPTEGAADVKPGRYTKLGPALAQPRRVADAAALVERLAEPRRVADAA